ncbi:MAG: diguanylate cyclase [Betaproteobacteria bacterium]|jgi:diguanylate cyclase|nr:diguanylate cyclase [Betaproteobacteria bacterium]MBK7657200.1 diguanylate cyclase [Betaproteobacteria bacterium]MBP6644513.1 diguanylate cyclase [Burkholderiaceae bacterium]
MNYPDSVERSTEYLRLALPMMSRQAAALHPKSYAIWYDYVSGRTASLRGAIDSHLAKHGQLDEASTDAVFQKYIAEMDPAAAKRMTDGFQRILTNMADSAAQAGDKTAKYGDALERLSSELSTQDDPSSMVSEVLQDTRDMSEAMATLRAKLDDSQKQINVLREEVLKARRESMQDALTGLANRRAFDHQMAVCLAAAQMAPPAEAGTNQRAACLVTSDIDHFKRINDTFGHGFGDQVLRAVSQVIKACTPGDSMAARVGGEEFAILIPEVELNDARQIAEKIRLAVAKARIRRQDTQEVIASVTMSLGVTLYRMGEDAREFIDRADRALYASKSGGRDRVTVMAA